jgi:hypothetical protein
MQSHPRKSVAYQRTLCFSSPQVPGNYNFISNDTVLRAEEQVIPFNYLTITWGYLKCFFHQLLLLVVRFEVSTATCMKMAVFWDVAPCRLLDDY